MAQKLNRVRAARILADVEAMGVAKAAQKWRVSRRTVERYVKLAAEGADPLLSQTVAEARRSVSAQLAASRARFQLAGMKKLEELAAKANKPEHLEPLSRALERVAQLDIVRLALGGDDDGDGHPGEDRTPPALAGAGGGSTSRPPAH